MKRKRPELVLVSWIDSDSCHGWLREEQCDLRGSKCESVGYLVKETKKVIVLAQSRGVRENQMPWGEIMTIPKVAITKRQTLST